MKKIAILSDVHGNLPALKAVIKRLEEEKPDLWICLGDLVGYGPNPSECVAEIRNRDIMCVKGNHDAGVVGEMPLKYFRNPNRKLIEFSQKLVGDNQKEWLSSLPLTITGGEGPQTWIAAHASPVRPANWEYLESAFKMRPILEKSEHQYSFIGHTHRPALVSETVGINTFQEGLKYFINPGSVGQPRDEDRRASCALLDLETPTYKNIRVEYDVTPALVDLEKMGFSRKESEYLLKI